ncbi:hypothetical protein ACIHCQ_27910 [Streptomyces sp. NPDC052236]|uniref:hypothetical protein n=1 Tax=Streptomyces sp. NPDC052236 TaxID=3365686 RepID=UPI0037D283F7
MADTPQEQLNGFVQAINDLHIATVRDEDARAASEAAANLHSGSGYLDAPMEVLEAFSRAIEIGYAAALQDVRQGKFDTDIAEWRPELLERE